MIDRETGLWIYNKMNEIRDFEETAWTLFTENKLRGSVHLYTGEEAVAASVCAQLTDEDYIASTHRGHGHCIAKGAELDRALAELMGKATGYCKGRSGSMHIADFSKGNLGANAIVGGGIPIATGGGLAIKMQNRKNVSVAFFGDGASNQGTFHESINLAAVWKLPVIYVCENNQFGMTVPTWQSTSVENIADRAAGYGIPGEVVDGNDVCAVYEAFARAKERALKGEGPTLGGATGPATRSPTAPGRKSRSGRRSGTPSSCSAPISPGTSWPPGRSWTTSRLPPPRRWRPLWSSP